MIARLCLVICAAAATAAAQNTTPDRFTPIGGAPYAGQLVSIDAGGQVQLRDAGGEAQTVALDTLRRIELGGRNGEATKVPDSLWLRSGQALPANLVEGKGTRAVFRLPFATTPIELPWSAVQAVCFHPDRAADPGFATSARGVEGRRDHVFAINGDVVKRYTLRVAGVSGKSLTIAGREQKLDLARVYGVAFGDQNGAPPDTQPNPRVAVQVGAQRVSGRLVSYDGDSCKLALAEGPVVTVPAGRVDALLISSDRLVLLGEFEPEVEQTPAFDTVWPWYRNRGADGGKITLGVQEFDRGYVMVPRTRLSFPLAGRFDTFEATIGMARGAGAQAHARFRVLADDKVVFDSGPVTRDSPPREIRVEINRAKRLILEADFGKNFDLGDVCVFANPRVLKK